MRSVPLVLALMALFSASDGETTIDRPCLETSSCEDLPERVRVGLPERE